jgi:predicted HAD superfamily Cof-like phosphohydrolase
MNKTNEEYIEEFHRAFGVSVGEEPTAELLKLRRALIKEEVEEFFEELDLAIEKLEKGEGIDKENYLNMLKEMADVQVVLSGTAVSIKQLKNFREAFLRVHRSNMSKLGKDGKPIYRADGKVLKGSNYRGPDLLDLV